MSDINEKVQSNEEKNKVRNLELKLAIEERRRLIIEAEREREREQKKVFGPKIIGFFILPLIGVIAMLASKDQEAVERNWL